MTMINSLTKAIGIAETGERRFSLGVIKPESLKCEFCGKELEYISTGNGPFKAWQQPDRCNCTEAIAYWQKYDENIVLINKEIETFKKTEVSRLEIEKLLSNSNLDRRFTNRTFDTFKITKQNEIALNKAKEYVIRFNEFETEGKGLLLTGQVGTGKTHLSAAIANYLMFKKYVPVKFGNVTSLLSEIKETYNDEENKKANKETEGKIIKSLSSVRLLIIDDLGKEKSTDWSNTIIYTIINNRYENYKPTIVTTNLSIKELENRIGDASVSRLIEMCDGIKMDGFDYRKTKLV